MSTNIYSTSNLADYMTVREAAEYLGVSTSTLRNWGRLGKLIPYRNPMNNYRLYKRTDLDSILGKIQEQRDNHE